MAPVSRRVGEIQAQAENAGTNRAWILPTIGSAAIPPVGKSPRKVWSCGNLAGGDLPTLRRCLLECRDVVARGGVGEAAEDHGCGRAPGGRHGLDHGAD